MQVLLNQHGTQAEVWKKIIISCLLDLSDSNTNLRYLYVDIQVGKQLPYILQCHSHSQNHCTLALKSDGNLYGSKTHSCTFLRSIETFFYCVIQSIQFKWNFLRREDIMKCVCRVKVKRNYIFVFFFFCYFNQDFKWSCLLP